MAMPLSGSLGIISCPAGACTSISIAVDGNITTPKSLTSLSIGAGKDAPHSMLEFYGYAPAVVNPRINIFLVNGISQPNMECLCGELVPTVTMPATDCYYPNYSWRMCANNASSSSSCVKIICNSVTIHQCAVSGNIYDCTGTWNAASIVDSNDVVNIITCVSNSVTDDIVMSCIRMTSITQSVGTYYLGSPSSQTSYLGPYIPD